MRFFSESHHGSGDFATFFAALSLMSKDKPDAVCSLLDIKPTTLRRYLSGESTPPHAMVRLLFMESYYGISAVTGHAVQAEALERRLSNSLTARLEAMRAHVTALELEVDALKRSSAATRDFAANSERWIA